MGVVVRRKFEMLQKRLEGMFGCKPTDFKRTYAGTNMKKSGAFVWEAKIGMVTIGSCWTVTELLKAKNIIQMDCGFNTIELIPE